MIQGDPCVLQQSLAESMEKETNIINLGTLSECTECSGTILHTSINPCPTQVLIGNLAVCLVCVTKQ